MSVGHRFATVKAQKECSCVVRTDYIKLMDVKRPSHCINLTSIERTMQSEPIIVFKKRSITAKTENA
jgi:hypothetical protein